MNIRHLELDEALVREINHSGRITYNELFRKIKKYRQLSRSTFNLHLKALEQQEFLSTSERKIGRRVYYSLTKKSSKWIQFHLFDSSRQESIQEKQGKMDNYSDLYQMLFYLSAKPPEYLLKNDHEFQKFLNVMVLNMNSLEIEDKFKPDRLPYCRNNIYYYSLVVTRYNPLPLSCLDGESREIYVRREDHRYCALQNKSENLFTVEQRKEAVDVEQKGKGNEGHVYYAILPGISTSDIINAHRILFRHMGNNNEDIERVIKLLNENKMIRPIAIFNGDIRYCVIDDRLRKLLLEYWTLYNFVTGKMKRIWDNFRAPSSEEREWFSRFWGSRATDDIFRLYYQRRQELKGYPEAKRMQFLSEEGNTILKYHTLIPRELAQLKMDFSDVFEKYSDFPLEALSEMVYPSFLQKDTLNDIRKRINFSKRESRGSQ